VNRPAKTLLVLALVGVVAMAFRVSWNALRDIAESVGADPAAAMLYPFVVDGLMALALVATLVLTDRDDRGFALRVLAGYTIASLVLNYVHGLVPALHGGHRGSRLADWAPANWALVLLATSLPVGSIFFGSDLVAKVLHHRPTSIANQNETPDSTANQSSADLRESTDPAPADSDDESAPTRPIDATDYSVTPAESAPVDPPPIPAPDRAPAALRKSRPSTGRVPQSARTPRPKRTPEELLTEARTATAGWSADELTAEGIRKAVHTSPANARMLRDTLKAERAEPALRLVETAVGGE
jgi:Protein of unknown function (DUF2637)